MTSIQIDALQLLKKHNRTCTELGENLWHDSVFGTRQSYARPAGALLHRLKRLGYVRPMQWNRQEQRFPWHITESGEEALRRLGCWAVL